MPGNRAIPLEYHKLIALSLLYSTLHLSLKNVLFVFSSLLQNSPRESSVFHKFLCSTVERIVRLWCPFRHGLRENMTQREKIQQDKKKRSEERAARAGGAKLFPLIMNPKRAELNFEVILAISKFESPNSLLLSSPARHQWRIQYISTKINC